MSRVAEWRQGAWLLSNMRRRRATASGKVKRARYKIFIGYPILVVTMVGVACVLWKEREILSTVGASNLPFFRASKVDIVYYKYAMSQSYSQRELLCFFFFSRNNFTELLYWSLHFFLTLFYFFSKFLVIKWDK